MSIPFLFSTFGYKLCCDVLIVSIKKIKKEYLQRVAEAPCVLPGPPCPCCSVVGGDGDDDEDEDDDAEPSRRVIQ